MIRFIICWLVNSLESCIISKKKKVYSCHMKRLHKVTYSFRFSEFVFALDGLLW